MGETIRAQIERTFDFMDFIAGHISLAVVTPVNNLLDRRAVGRPEPAIQLGADTEMLRFRGRYRTAPFGRGFAKREIITSMKRKLSLIHKDMQHLSLS